MHSDQKYIDALVNHHQQLVSEIYRRFAPNMKAYLCSRGCSEEDAGDLFQDALIDIYKMAIDKNFVLTCPFEAFLLLLCKRKFINKMKKNSASMVTNLGEREYTDIQGDVNSSAVEQVLQIQKEKLVMEVLNEMGNCKEVILKSLIKKPQEEIAEELGMTYAYYRKRKSNCMGDLVELLRNKPEYKEMAL